MRVNLAALQSLYTYASCPESSVPSFELGGESRKKISKSTPAQFFSYIIFQIVKSGILFIVYRYSPDNYFDAYWAGNAISVLLGVAVMDEILQHLLKQYGGIQKLASVLLIILKYCKHVACICVEVGSMHASSRPLICRVS